MYAHGMRLVGASVLVAVALAAPNAVHAADTSELRAEFMTIDTDRSGTVTIQEYLAAQDPAPAQQRLAPMQPRPSAWGSQSASARRDAPLFSIDNGSAAHND